MAPGHEHHGSAMVQALEHHLEETRGLRGAKGWTYTRNMGDKFNPGFHSYSSLLLDSDGIYPEAAALDLSHPPIYAFAVNMLEHNEPVTAVVQMLSSFGMDREAARSVIQEAWAAPLKTALRATLSGLWLLVGTQIWKTILRPS